MIQLAQFLHEEFQMSQSRNGLFPTQKNAVMPFSTEADPMDIDREMTAPGAPIKAVRARPPLPNAKPASSRRLNFGKN